MSWSVPLPREPILIPGAPAHHAYPSLTRRGQGCANYECKLCKHNPYKRCKDHFAPKYLVSDTLAAKCGGAIAVEVVGHPNAADLPAVIEPGLHLEVSLRCPAHAF